MSDGVGADECIDLALEVVDLLDAIGVRVPTRSRAGRNERAGMEK